MFPILVIMMLWVNAQKAKVSGSVGGSQMQLKSNLVSWRLGGSTYQFSASSTAAKKPTTAPSRIASATTNAQVLSNNSGNAGNARKEKPEATTTAPTKPSSAGSTLAKPTPHSHTTTAKSNSVVHAHSSTTGELATMKAAYDEQSKQYSELKLEVDGLEKERDFYFDKLRDIEIMLQDLEEQGLYNSRMFV
jgi:hypothetical protein